ncbi:hypothetical protein HK096_006183 [Nowakowskiella sp. JEL0078]|nr:hypothetical protein HK096_006183 [Nowakowskiella sp. JEL0078]
MAIRIPFHEFDSREQTELKIEDLIEENNTNNVEVTESQQVTNQPPPTPECNIKSKHKLKEIQFQSNDQLKSKIFQNFILNPQPSNLSPNPNSRTDNAKNSPFVSLHICKNCQQSLLTAFSHCLFSKSTHNKENFTEKFSTVAENQSRPINEYSVQNDNNTHIQEELSNEPQNQSIIMLSQREIDDSTAAFTSDPPYFELIKDPSLPTPQNNLYTDTKDRVQKERAVQLSIRRERHSQNTSQNYFPQSKFRLIENENNRPKNLPTDTHRQHDFPFSGVQSLTLKQKGEKLLKITANPYIKYLHQITRIGEPNSQLKKINSYTPTLFQHQIMKKKRTINDLKDELQERTQRTINQQIFVNSLRKALHKSNQYYGYVEEWQEHESAVLQQDIRNLKSELQSLMGILITSEDDKRKLLCKIDQMKVVLQEREKNFSQLDKSFDKFKNELHEKYKQYLKLNSDMIKLQDDAKTGTKFIMARNEILQRNIDKLAKDFEVSSRELSSAQTRLKELEFNLEGQVALFNVCGEAKKSLEDYNQKTTLCIANYEKEIEKTQENNRIYLKRKEDLETEIYTLKKINEDAKPELTLKLNELKSKIDKFSALKSELEATIKQLKFENDKLTSATRSLTKAKDSVESALRQCIIDHEKLTASKKKIIQELELLQKIDSEKISKLNEHKALFESQISEVQDALDLQTENLTQVQVEMQRIKKSSDESSELLQVEIDKLNSAKNNLLADKRQLVDKMVNVTNDFNSAVEKLELFSQNYSVHMTETEAAIFDLEEQFSKSTDTHLKLKKEFEDLTIATNTLMDENLNLKLNQSKIIKYHEELDKKESKNQAEIKRVLEDNHALNNEIFVLNSNCNDMKVEINGLSEQINDLTNTIDCLTNDTEELTKSRNAAMNELNIQLQNTHEEMEGLQNRYENLKNKSEDLTLHLKDTKKKLSSEVLHRETLEMQIYEMRIKVTTESARRRQYERMHQRINRHKELYNLEKENTSKFRSSLINESHEDMASIVNRLANFIKLLPSEDQFKD